MLPQGMKVPSTADTKNTLRGTYYTGSKHARVCMDTSRTGNEGQASLVPCSLSLWLMGMHTTPQGQSTAVPTQAVQCITPGILLTNL